LGAFEVQPSYTLLFLECLFLGVTLAVWFARRREETRNLTVAGGAVAPFAPPPRRRGRGGDDHRMREVPIPWGWPNCRFYRGKRSRRSMSESLHYFADVLFREKQLVSDVGPDPRITDSIRALIEDRYRPVARSPIAEAAAVRPLADEDIWYVGPVAETRAAADLKYRTNLHEVRELRAPWGW
jgi:hypothetical protein